MGKAAAAEAARSGRKTISYDDVSRLAQIFDRFSFLQDVLPPTSTTALQHGSSARRQATTRRGIPKKASEPLSGRSRPICKDGAISGDAKTEKGGYKPTTARAAHASVGIESPNQKKLRF
ncbi:unnamed protein product [Phytomonas sp. Hart1]|nr:unnamed protein product [Phytomonas sp. Hart1]|eukprot:CCW66547.1 unnamed protein product [Phytomonas sp. isolate Hart1]